MNRHHIDETGNIAAFQRQLGHTNVAYSIQYVRVTDQELAEALDDRWSFNPTIFFSDSLKIPLLYPDQRSGKKEILLASSFAIYGAIWINRRVGVKLFF